MLRRLVALVCACLAAWLVFDALPVVDQILHTRPGDGVVDWLGARAWLAHVNVYSPEGLQAYGLGPYGFAHPPTAPFWLLPYTAFDVDGLGMMMGWTTILLLVFHVAATARALDLPLSLAALAFALVLHASWMHDDLRQAQVSEPIAFLYLIAWLALREERDLGAGVAIGLACTFKPFAGVLWLMLVCLRRWRAAAAAIAAWAAIATVMTARFGLVAWRQWNEFNHATAVVWMGHIRNATLPGVILRAAHPICQGRGPGPTLATTILAVLAGALILAACWWLSRRASATTRRGQIDVLFVAWATASVFVNPVAWEHYALLLLTPLAILLAAALDWQRTRAARIGALVAAIATAALLSIDMYRKVRAVDHVRKHLLEAANWAPWAIVLIAALYLMGSDARAARRRYGS